MKKLFLALMIAAPILAAGCCNEKPKSTIASGYYPCPPVQATCPPVVQTTTCPPPVAVRPTTTYSCPPGVQPVAGTWLPVPNATATSNNVTYSSAAIAAPAPAAAPGGMTYAQPIQIAGPNGVQYYNPNVYTVVAR